MGALQITESERERRRELARKLHAEGKFGGRQPGAGRPRKKRASEVIAEQVAAEGQELFDRLMTIARDGNDGNAITAIKELLGVEKVEADRMEKQNERLEDMKRDQLLALVAKQLEGLKGVEGFAGIVDGEVVELADEGSGGTRQITASAE